MKIKKEKKLNLNKETLINLNKLEIKEIKGGATDFPVDPSYGSECVNCR